jgi:thymidylate synthase ThyX
MSINFNPNLPPNDSLSNEEIFDRAVDKREQLKQSIAKAYQTALVSEGIAENVAEAIVSDKFSKNWVVMELVEVKDGN